MKKPMKISYSKSLFAGGIASIAIILTLVWILVPTSQPEPLHGQTPAPAVASTDIPVLCDSNNNGPFDGKVLYVCVFGLVAKTDLKLIDKESRNAFIDKWQHKFDHGDTLNQEESAYSAISSMVNDLHEMHTAFLPPKAASQLSNAVQGDLIGIGAPMTRIGMRRALKALGENPSQEALATLNKITESTLLVVYPAPAAGSPAELAGLQQGDQIVAVDGNSIVGKTMKETVADISGNGQAGTKVVLSIKRPSKVGLEDIEIAITRGALHFQQVSTKALDKGYLYVRVLSFTKTVATELSDALYLTCTGKALPYDTKDLLAVIHSYQPEQDCGIKGVVFDFRNNGGGVMEEALDMGQTIMQSGNTVTIKKREGDRSVEVRQKIDGEHYVQELAENGSIIKSVNSSRVFRVLPKIPMVALVNGMSASASEILVGMLRANGLATVVGTPCFGKEVGQAFKPIDFGAAVKITTFRFLPGGVALDSGIIPDFEIEQSDAFIDNPTVGEDSQLEKAIEVLGRGQEAMKEAQTAAAIEAKARRSIAVKAEHDKRDSKIMNQLNQQTN